MSTKHVTTVGGYALMSAAAFTLMLLPGALTAPPAVEAGPPPDTVDLTGIVRDFPEAHPDFAVVPAGGFGHYAGTVDPVLGPDARPVHVTGGFRVAAPWLDDAGMLIAPHLAGVGGSCTSVPRPPLAVDGVISFGQNTVLDAYDSSQGAFDPSAPPAAGTVACTNSVTADTVTFTNNAVIDGDLRVGPGGSPAVVVNNAATHNGSVGTLGTEVAMPVAAEPVGLPPYPGPSVGDYVTAYDEVVTIAGDMHVNLLHFRRGSIVTIDGDVTIMCEGAWLIEKDVRVIISDGSRLHVYAKGAVGLVQGAEVNCTPDTADPGRMRLSMTGAGNLDLDHPGTRFCGRVDAPDATLDLDNESQFFGTFLGRHVLVKNWSQVHVDLFDYGDVLLDPVNDTAGAASAAGSGGVTSAGTFEQWFTDVPSINLSKAHVLTMVKDASGVYRGGSTSFYPVDDQLLGNEGDAHNNYFTFSLSATFVYEQCAGQFLLFTGGDGAWLFVDGQLVIDLGGMRHQTDQYVALDRLGLADGQEYRLDLFYAHRDPTAAIFKLDTNLDLSTDGVLPAVSAAFD